MPLEPEPDILVRRVLLALELLDPVSGDRITAGMTVRARGADGDVVGGPPVTSLSGRFAWFETGAPPPVRLVCDPGRLPYAPEEIDLPSGPPQGRLVSRMLRPSRAYGAPAGVTALRGRLVERVGDDATPIAGAIVQIVWGIEAARWIPPAPPGAAGMRPGEALTDADGEFFVLSRPPRTGTRFSDYVGSPREGDPGFDASPVSLDVDKGLVRARVRVTRPDAGASRATPAAFVFPGVPVPGRLPDGRMPAGDLELNWRTLE